MCLATCNVLTCKTPFPSPLPPGSFPVANGTLPVWTRVFTKLLTRYTPMPSWARRDAVGLPCPGPLARPSVSAPLTRPMSTRTRWSKCTRQTKHASTLWSTRYVRRRGFSIQTFLKFNRHLYGGSVSLFTLHTNLCKTYKIFVWRASKLVYTPYKPL